MALAGIAFVAAVLYVFGTLFRAEMDGTERVIWVLVILAFPLIGAFIWLSWGQDSVKQRALRQR
jgi:uncharacterized membrane protein